MTHKPTKNAKRLGRKPLPEGTRVSDRKTFYLRMTAAAEKWVSEQPDKKRNLAVNLAIAYVALFHRDYEYLNEFLGGEWK